MIAALMHKFTVVILDVADFADMGINLVNPWQIQHLFNLITQ